MKKLGKNQLYIIEQINAIGDMKPCDSQTSAVLRSLERRGLVYVNYGLWRLSKAGLASAKKGAA